MSHQFKPGDLAVIVGCNMFTENLGKVCELKQFLAGGDTVLMADGVLTISPGDCWLVEGDDVIGAYQCRLSREITRVASQALVQPSHLMPLLGDFAPAQQKSREVVA